MDFWPYKILGACNPPFADQALQAEDEIGTMLPFDVVSWVSPGLIENGRLQRPNLRIVLGDLIVAFEDTPITSSHDLILALERRNPGETARLSVFRESLPVAVDLTLDEPP